MEQLRLAFLVIGGIAIIGILAHGMWSVRKTSKDNRASLETPEWDEDYDDIEDVVVDDDSVIVNQHEDTSLKVEPKMDEGSFDDLGLGAVRVVATNNVEAATSDDNQQGQQTDSVPSTTDLSENAQQLDAQESEQTNESITKPKIYSSVVTQPKPEYAAQQVQAMRSKSALSGEVDGQDIPEPPPFLLKTSEAEPVAVDPAVETTDLSQSAPEKLATETKQPAAFEQKSVTKDLSAQIPADENESPSEDESKVSLAEQARNFVKRSKAESKPKPRKRREPKIREDQMRIDFDEPVETAQSQSKQDHPEAGQSESGEQAQEVLVLNVRATDENPIQGAALLPMLLTLGFKFGEQDIFHRHVNSNGKGPVLFSLANMIKPGIFDIDNLETFSTPGVSLFMMLPIEGDPHQVFNMMHNAARKIAEEFSAQVLDGRRSALTKQSLQQYVEKIREFERKRMIAR
ncbi:cell division protein ZipA [Aliiglaciecola sp.]|nr:cell division protein ZipA [Aliiglaciecola sp.]